jgi:hypothetical protein
MARKRATFFFISNRPGSIRKTDYRYSTLASPDGANQAKRPWKAQKRAAARICLSLRTLGSARLRDHKNKGLGGSAEAEPFQSNHAASTFSAAC